MACNGGCDNSVMEHDRSGLPRWALVVWTLAAVLAGCRSVTLRPPEAAYLSRPSSDVEAPIEVTAYRLDATFDGSQLAARSQQELAFADELDRRGQDRSVDVYYRATLHAAQALQVGGFPSAEGQAAWQAYHRGLAGLIDAGQRYGRLDPRGQLTLREGVAARHSDQLLRVQLAAGRLRPTCVSRAISQPRHYESSRHRRVGVGPDRGAKVGHRRSTVLASSPTLRRDRGLAPHWAGRTGRVVRPRRSCARLLQSPGDFRRHLARPAHFLGPRSDGAAGGGRERGAAAVPARVHGPHRYFGPTQANHDRALRRGKIPVVFIHGLYSDPITWVDVFNDLRVQPDLYERFQFWAFRYPTGGVVLESAAQLRAQLALARQLSAPANDDPALDSMVLIGHSLGGLLSKMQIVNSYDLLWNQAARQPLDAVRASPQVRMRLARDFFFEPLPFVLRVVFVGTPHQGSVMARRLAGRIGSSLVNFGPQAKQEYLQVINANRDVFKPAVTESRPTAVNFLEPNNPFLNALGQMPVNPAVRLHSIVGTGKLSPVGEPGDGVVSVSSARCRGVDSEWFVPAQHEKLHRDPESIVEMARILRLHANELRSPEAPLAATR